MTQFLPPISAMTLLDVALARDDLAAVSRMFRPGGDGAGEDDRVDARVGDQRLAGLVAAREERQRVVRDAAGVQRVDDGLGSGRLLGGLEHDGVAGRQRGETMPAAIASGKFHGAITPVMPRAT